MINYYSLSREELAGHLDKYLFDTGEKQADIARALGVHDNRISTWKNGTYPGKIAEMTRKIAEHLTLKQKEIEAKRNTVHINFVETRQSQAIEALINFCQVEKEMGLIHGESGLGKTTTAKHIADNNSQVIMITAVSKMNQLDVLMALLYQLNVPLKKANRSKALNKLENILKEGMKVIIVDEAQKLRFEPMETLRYLHDVTGVGIAFLGTDDVLDRMRGRGKEEYDQIYSRLGMKIKLRKTIINEDLRKMLEVSGINNGNGIVKYVKRLMESQGHYRTATKHIKMAMRMAAGENRDTVQLSDFQAAKAVMWGED